MIRKLSASLAVSLLVMGGAFSVPGPEPVRAAPLVATGTLPHIASVDYTGGTDLEFQERMVPVNHYVPETRTAIVTRCTRRSRSGRCTRSRRQRVTFTTMRPVVTMERRVYLYAGSLAAMSAGPAGLRIFDITDPAKPQLQSFYTCHSNQNDIQLLYRGDRTYALLGLDYQDGANLGSQCFSDLGIPRTSVGVVVVDVTDVSAPRAVTFIPLRYGAHNLTMHPGGRYAYVSDSQLGTIRPTPPGAVIPPLAAIQILDLADVHSPRFVGEFVLPPGGSSHDITFSADGLRAYSAAITQTLVIDSSDPPNPRLVSVIEDPVINIHHQSDPFTMNDRRYLVVTDELNGGAGNGSCPGGGLHIYDITVEYTPVKVGVFFIPEFAPAASGFPCTSHVLRIEPSRRIMTIAWYRGGTWVIDISNPSLFKAVGFAVPSSSGRPANTWSAKMYNGYIYSNDIRRGLDVFRYDGPSSALQMQSHLSRLPVVSVPAPAASGPVDRRPMFCFELGEKLSVT